MVSANWDTFTNLPGAATYNFEMLCRHLMHRHYAAHGDFKATANQAGVEFHLKVDSHCALGEAGRWYGWQCRWYDLPPARAITKTRKDKIEKAIETTLDDLPGLTDWVLWTRYPLTARDQAWFYGLQAFAGSMRLTLWSSANVEEHLAGPGELYRATYFGELTLTPDNLHEMHERAVAPVRFRWLPDAHQPIDAERILQQMLGGTAARNQLKVAGSALDAARAVITPRLTTDVPLKLQHSAEAFATFLGMVHNHVLAVIAGLEQGDWQTLQECFSSVPRLLPPQRTFIRHLRNAQSPLALPATNALDDLNSAIALLVSLEEQLSACMVAVVAGAGNGKTHLAAQLTNADTDRPSGVFLQGRQLAARDSLDDLVRTVSVGGRPCPNMEALLAALDAAGERAHRRLPLVIDGLNEAEDPRQWRNLLSSVEPLLSRYPHVLLVCTLRKDFTDECLPAATRQLFIDGFADDRAAAVDRYFAYYRIDPTDADLPEHLFDNPLALRLFCEVTNPDRTKTVGIEAMPGSLTAVLDRYLEQAADRVAELSPVHFRVYPADVRTALEKIGRTLWEGNANGVEFDRLRMLIDTDPRWDCSLVRMLEQEGVLLRMPIKKQPGNTGMIISYDALAGHLIANAVIAERDRETIARWLSAPETVSALDGAQDRRHPLAQDIFTALAGLLPRRRDQQLWRLVEGELQDRALILTTALEPRYLDGPTVETLEALLCNEEAGHDHLFKSLMLVRGAPAHPLNADFLHRALRQIGVAERDRIWTEWARRRWRNLAGDLRELEQRWTTGPLASPRDLLRARWAMWLLTSTVRDLRDQATRTLYWFGRTCPDGLFDLALASLQINDPYVSERTMAAAYGIVMAHQLPDDDFGATLRQFLIGVRDALISPKTARPTNDWLVRLYVQGIFHFAAVYYPYALPEEVPDCTELEFSSNPTAEPIVEDDPRGDEVSRTLHMDFKNYTVGRLVEDRANYDHSHPQYQQVLAQIKGTIWSLGWRKSTFGDIDSAIADESYHQRERSGNVERYGKKYSWIGFYAAAGRLQETGELKPATERLSELGIDPSFPSHLPPLQIAIPDWAQPTPANVEEWVIGGEVAVPPELLQPSELDGHSGPWIVVGGHLETNMQVPGRHVWGFLNAVLVDKGDVTKITAAFSAKDYPGRHWIPESPEDYYTFAGEIPWHPTFAHIHDEGDPYDPYLRGIHLEEGVTVPVEVITHRFRCEGYHSALNDVGSVLIPSKEISRALDLRAGPQLFHQFDSSGAVASLSYGPPPRMTGHLLYIRHDTLRDYAQGRDLVLMWWGERLPRPHPSDEWLERARQVNKEVWRIVRHVDLSGG